MAEGFFYAVKVVIGNRGAFTRLRTNADAQVLSDSHGPAIPGFYAVGNDAASIMGGAYPGGGITFGPAITSG